MGGLRGIVPNFHCQKSNFFYIRYAHDHHNPHLPPPKMKIFRSVIQSPEKLSKVPFHPLSHRAIQPPGSRLDSPRGKSQIAQSLPGLEGGEIERFRKRHGRKGEGFIHLMLKIFFHRERDACISDPQTSIRAFPISATASYLPTRRACQLQL